MAISLHGARLVKLIRKDKINRNLGGEDNQ